MAKKTASKPGGRRKKRLPPITGVSRLVVDHVINAAVLGEYPGCCSVEDLAASFKRQPTRFRTTLNRLVEAGYLEIAGRVLEMVYPTAAALVNQDPKLTHAEAEQIVRRLKRTR